MRNKRVLACLMALVMTFSLSVFVYAAEADGQTVVTLLHTNDVHGRFVAGSGIIGIATVAAAKDAFDNALLLDAGDAIHGLPFATVSKGADPVKLMGLAGYDVWTPGNHDFNYGYERLLELAEASDINLTSCNVYKDGKALMQAYVTYEVAGAKIAVIGVSTPETTYKTAGENIKGLTFEDPITHVQALVKELKATDVDVIVVLSHLGTDETSADTSTALANAVPEIDVIIDGHSHTLFETGNVVNGVLIASTGDNGGHLGFVNITLGADNQIAGIEASVMDAETAAATYTADADVEALVAAIDAEQQALLGEVIGKTATELSAERSPGVRTMEMPLGNLIADALLETTGADIAFTNGGGIRATIAAGDITKKDIVTCLPFGNFVVTKSVTPAVLKSLMENGVSKLPEPDGRFPQIAGFTFTYDASQPVGSRVTGITYKGAALDLADNTTKLLMATNDFSAKGGDEYTALSFIEIETEYSALDEVVIAYIQKTDKAYSAAEGRITEAAAAAPVVEEVASEAVEETVEETVEATTEEATEEPEAAAAEPVAVVPVLVDSATPFPVGANATVDNCWFLNVRKGSGPSYDAFTYIAKGDTVTVLDYQNQWILIDTPKGQGWVYEGYLTR